MGRRILGIGLANDLCEVGAVATINEAHRLGLCSYLTVYTYENYTPQFLQAMRAAMPPALRYVWHAGGDIELPFEGDAIAINRRRIDDVISLWDPAWITEDIIVTSFGRTCTAGAPNYVPLFLTQDCLDVCIRRMHAAQDDLGAPFYPEVPHFFVPGPDEMHLATFFRRFVEATGARLNFDVGHYFSYNMLHRRPLLDRIEEFPLEAVGEINTAGGMIGDAGSLTWIDDYAGPINPVTIEALRAILPRCTTLEAMYTETIGAPPWVVFHNLRILNDLFWPHMARLQDDEADLRRAAE